MLLCGALEKHVKCDIREDARLFYRTKVSMLFMEGVGCEHACDVCTWGCLRTVMNVSPCLIPCLRQTGCPWSSQLS